MESSRFKYNYAERSCSEIDLVADIIMRSNNVITFKVDMDGWTVFLFRVNDYIFLLYKFMIAGNALR